VHFAHFEQKAHFAHFEQFEQNDSSMLQGSKGRTNPFWPEHVEWPGEPPPAEIECGTHESRNGAEGVEQKPAQDNEAEKAEIWRAARCAAISEAGGWTPLFQRDLQKSLKARKEFSQDQQD